MANLRRIGLSAAEERSVMTRPGLIPPALYDQPILAPNGLREDHTTLPLRRLGPTDVPKEEIRPKFRTARYSSEAPPNFPGTRLNESSVEAYSPAFGVLFRRTMGCMAKHLESLEQFFIVTGPFWAPKERHLSIPGLPYRLTKQLRRRAK